MIDPSPITDDELAALFVETGDRHHQAYIESDGSDPDWALWYAPYVQTKLWDRLGRLLTRSEVVYLLVGADLAVRNGSDAADWAKAYAKHFRSYVESTA
jgi:NAD(P)H-hydrate epimerase